MTSTAIRTLLVACAATLSASTGHGAPAQALAADDACQAAPGSQECAPATSLLQVQAAAADKTHKTHIHNRQSAEQAMSQASSRRRPGATGTPSPSQRLAMVHVPCNFGHTIEGVALDIDGVKFLKAAFSFRLPDREQQWEKIRAAAGPGAEFWGQMNPDLRTFSKETGCEMFYTPQSYWPEELAASYFGNRTVFGMLRNPYDRVVNEFRMQLMVMSSFYTGETRADVSRREGHMEKEREPYTTWYDTCDVNAWVKSELAKYKSGDRFRGNCHLLPQAEFFRGKYGISLALDVAGFPGTFNKAMEEHGYTFETDLLGHNTECAVSAWDLDEEAVALIKEVYAEDFELNCKHFGVCGDDVKACCCDVPGMCGGAPADYCARAA